VVNSEFVVVCHGTIEDRYGQDTLVDAARILRDEMPDLRVIITGCGSRTSELMKSIADNGLQEMCGSKGG